MASRGLVEDIQGIKRCFWCGEDQDYQAYHDQEWGFPVTDDHRLFEKICLEGFQAGLSWLTILRKRPAFRRAFQNFDYARVACYGEEDVEALMLDATIVRHRGKIEATINNARRALELVQQEGSLAAYFWRFEPDPRGRPRKMTRGALMKLTTCPEARALSRDLKQRGFRFVGPTTAYAFMQAMGLVNDHIEGCHMRARVAAAREQLVVPGSP